MAERDGLGPVNSAVLIRFISSTCSATSLSGSIRMTTSTPISWRHPDYSSTVIASAGQASAASSSLLLCSGSRVSRRTSTFPLSLTWKASGKITSHRPCPSHSCLSTLTRIPNFIPSPQTRRELASRHLLDAIISTVSDCKVHSGHGKFQPNHLGRPGWRRSLQI